MFFQTFQVPTVSLAKKQGQGVRRQMVWCPQSPDRITKEVVLGFAETEARQPEYQNELCPIFVQRLDRPTD